MAASATVPKGMPAGRVAGGHGSWPPLLNAPSLVGGGYDLGGAPALAWTETCDPETVNSNKVAALHGGRGYMIYMPSDAANDAEDRRIFEGIRQSFRFTS
jgi:hypothetical protein